jgi:hypothetical protein
LRHARAAILGSGSPDRDVPAGQIAETIRRLRMELVHHFAEEEEGGCLDEAVSRCPRLGPDARRIEAEHQELLAKLESLLAQATDGEISVQDRVALEGAFDDFCRQMRAHEAAESDVLRQAFGANINGGEDSTRPTLTMDV